MQFAVLRPAYYTNRTVTKLQTLDHVMVAGPIAGELEDICIEVLFCN
jgi:hypothetical protein